MRLFLVFLILYSLNGFSQIKSFEEFDKQNGCFGVTFGKQKRFKFKKGELKLLWYRKSLEEDYSFFGIEINRIYLKGFKKKIKEIIVVFQDHTHDLFIERVEYFTDLFGKPIINERNTLPETCNWESYKWKGRNILCTLEVKFRFESLKGCRTTFSIKSLNE